MTDRNHTAFIFARGGSRGVRDKNIRLVADKPLIAHSIDTALASTYIDTVLVSTDSDEIAAVSTSYGAKVLSRPAELAADNSPELLAWKHAIESSKAYFSSTSTFVSLPATSPLRAASDIDKAIEKFQQGSCDILFGISQAHRNPYLNMVKVNKDKLIEILNSGSKAVRRQGVPPVYDVTTCVYIGDTDYILACDRLMQGRVGYIEIPVERALDIDTEYDLYLANLILSHPFTKGPE